MTRQQVESSNIASIGWESEVLEVEFHTGAVYQYSGVPEREYQRFMDAESIGRYFQQNIRPAYHGERVR